MTTDQPDTDPRNAIVHALICATMPDGSPISSWVKAETMLSQLGITDCPDALMRLITTGISERFRQERRRVRGGHREDVQPAASEPVQEPETMPPLSEIAPPRNFQRPAAPPSRRELSPSSAPKLSRRDRERRDGPELVNHSRRTGGFPLGETVRITIKERLTS